MTHDELLAKINEKEPGTLTYSNGEIFHSTRRFISWQLALRAVVELHKPHIFTDNDGYEWIYCTVCTDGFETFPCPTIQTIEKELK